MDGGSSPHTRGALSIGNSCGGRARIIPAYAGSTSHWGAPRHLPADHPRIRGEHGGCLFVAGDFEGSSPHTRGAPYGMGFCSSSTGIIPAYAGSTIADPRRRQGPKDHPRIRGEHAVEVDGADQVGGSSPHTRGARRAAPAEGELHGIIPAYAGSTSPASRRMVTPLDHPRIRGEHSAPTGQTPRAFGSSPHTRGARPRNTKP